MTPEQAERYARSAAGVAGLDAVESVWVSQSGREVVVRVFLTGEFPLDPPATISSLAFAGSQLQQQLEPHLALERLERTHTFHARTEPCYVCADLALLRQAIETLEAARTDARGERIMRAMARWENVDVASMREKLARLEAEVARLRPLAAPVWPEPEK